VLVLISDDFKPLLQSYDSPLVKTPNNIDGLIARGVAFMNAHAQMAMCGPSRASFMVSLRPDTLQIYELAANQLASAIKNKARTGPSGIAPIPQVFKQNGSLTYGIGKIFHENEFALMQDPALWTTPVFTWLSQYARSPSFTPPYQGSWIDFPDVTDDAFSDGQAAIMAAQLIATLAAQATPWLLMVGLWKPHLPWRAPFKYVDQTSSFNAAFGGGVTNGLTQAQYLLAHGPACGETGAYGGPNQLQSNTVGCSLPAHLTGIAPHRPRRRNARAPTRPTTALRRTCTSRWASSSTHWTRPMPRTPRTWCSSGTTASTSGTTACIASTPITSRPRACR
jgi:hypothetical protein